MDSIDSILCIVLMLILVLCVFCQSEIMGLGALLFSFLVVFKTVFKESKDRNGFYLEKSDKTLLIFFLIVTLSLCGSTLFALSFHGYLKTLIYILFFFSVSIYFSDSNNKNKILPIMLVISGLMSYESIVAILQNMGGVAEISGWQDISNINPEEVVSRAYGTLKPYNPNLLAGYLLCGLSSFIYLIFYFLKIGKRKLSLGFSTLLIINLIAVIDTGCRGAYLGFMLFFPVLFLALGYYIYQSFGGFQNIKKRYKNFIILAIIGIFTFILADPALIKRFESIFAFRADSSISFRLNVYESAWNMFLDNPFLGIGCGNQNFREIYGLYMKTGFDALGSYCVPLEIAVESGIFALLTFILFLYFVIEKCFKYCLNKELELKDKILALSVVLMICSTMGHGLFDTIWFRPQLQILFWLNIGMLKTIKK